MPKLQSPTSMWDESKGWVGIGLSAYLLWNFRGVFTNLGDAAAAKAAAAMAGAQAQAKLATDRAAVKAALGSNYIATEEEIATWRADARSLMGYFDSTSTLSLQRQQGEAFSLLKQRYPRLMLYNNKPFKWKDTKHTSVVPQNVADANSVKNPTYWKVLVPFYKEATEGRDLLKDIHLFIYDSDKKALFKWIL